MYFNVKALQGDQRIVSLEVSAANLPGAADYARAQGYTVLHVSSRAWRLPQRGKRAQKFSTLLFSQELLALLAAGLSLMEALDALKGRSARGYAEGVIPGIVRALSEGNALSVAIARYPQHFPPLYIALIQASERTGDLPEALRRFIEYQQQMERVRKKLVSATLYPALLAGVGTLVVLFLLLYVVPRFSKVYENMPGQLPFFSRLLMRLGSTIADHGGLVIAVIGAIAAAATWAVRSPHARARVGLWFGRIPVIAEHLRLYELTRLYRTLGMLLKGGVPVTRAIGMASGLMRTHTRNDLDRAAKLVSQGRAISAAMETTGLTTHIAARMLAVGERTGDMGLMMERIALFHEEDLARWIEDFGKLFEPVLMLGIGVVVGAIVVLMYMPIFELATAIQ